MPRYRVTTRQTVEITYELDAADETEATTEVETGVIEDLDNWEINYTSYGANVVSVELETFGYPPDTTPPISEEPDGTA